ncbi:hypothetical protein [Candidatus Vondammii sp. HM_W22]|nr:hypothetical protein [Candidatus Vondammii sp. HM_W22]
MRSICSGFQLKGKFDQGKSGYRLNDIWARRADAAWISSIFLVR